MNPGITHAIGIDIGGTKIAGSVVELNTGRILARRHHPTLPQRGGEAVLADVLHQASDLAAEARSRDMSATAIGVGLPQLVTPDGHVRSDHLFDWRDVPAAERLSEI